METEQLEQARPGAFTRRTALRAAAWSAPAITIMNAAPAFAASPGGSPTLTASWNDDSFRTNSGDNLAAGTPSTASNTYIAVRIDLAVSGGTLTNPTAVLQTRSAAPNGVTIPNHSKAGSRGSTQWPINQGALAEDGWTVDPGVSSTQYYTFTFTQAGASFSAGQLRFIIGGFATGTTGSTPSIDFPATLTFDAAELATPVVMTFETTATTPFVAEI